MVVNTETLKDNPDLGKALVGIWYETMALMTDPGEKGKAAREAMAKLSGTDLAGFEAQLEHHLHVLHAERCGRLHDERRPAQDHGSGAQLLFEHNLLGEGVKSKDAIGIEFPGARRSAGKNKSSCASMRRYMKMAADGKL